VTDPVGPVCVYCRRRAVTPAWRPFCSERCKLQDLARWAEGSYRVPAEPAAEPDDIDAQEVRPRTDPVD
jgi:endogenous inhibitor of DNA gyrase (YacG/DUF329 family)